MATFDASAHPLGSRTVPIFVHCSQVIDRSGDTGGGDAVCFICFFVLFVAVEIDSKLTLHDIGKLLLFNLSS